MTGLRPWKFSDDPTPTARTLVPCLTEGGGYVQIKEVPSRSDETPVMQGTREIPLGPLLDLLTEGNYAGPVSREMRTVIGPRRRAFESRSGGGFRRAPRPLRRSTYPADRVEPESDPWYTLTSQSKEMRPLP